MISLRCRKPDGAIEIGEYPGNAAKPDTMEPTALALPVCMGPLKRVQENFRTGIRFAAQTFFHFMPPQKNNESETTPTHYLSMGAVSLPGFFAGIFQAVGEEIPGEQKIIPTLSGDFIFFFVRQKFSMDSRVFIFRKFRDPRRILIQQAFPMRLGGSFF